MAFRAFKYPNVKTKRTFYTEKKLENCRKNIEKYDWAKKMVQEELTHAQVYLDYGIENIFTNMTSQFVPRSYMVNQERGCPICGLEIEQYGRFPWLADTIHKPFKIECPNCHNVFPSNDFESYYKSGLDEYGCFDRKKADPKYLVNELYPDKPSDWCVDDGYGWINPDYDRYNRYTFIADYNHWYLWHDLGWAGYPLITRALSSFKNAYLYTNDKKYAYAGIVILNRMADLYPDMDSSVFTWEDGFKNSHGLTGRGKIVGCIWETGLIKAYVSAYDAFFPAIDEGALEAIYKIPLYQNMDYHVKTADDIKKNIENNVIHEVYPGVLQGTITGNVGMAQSALAMAAVVIDCDEYADKWIDQIFDGRDEVSWKRQGLTEILVNVVDRDGIGDESSPEYNNIWTYGLSMVADILYGYKKPEYDLYQNPKFVKMFNLCPSLVVIGEYTPSIGDTKFAGDPGITLNKECALSFFEKTKDVKTAQLLKHVSKIEARKGKDPAICQNIFMDCETIEQNINDIIEKHGEYRSESKNLTGYGFASMVTTDHQDEKATWLYYGRNTGHGHRDTLNLNLHGFGVDLLPDHGYPGYADGNFERYCWTINSIAHNLVVVDRERQESSFVAVPKHYDGKHSVQVIDMEAPLVYPQTRMYRRSCITVNLQDMMYAVDFFRVAGGKEHLFSFHAAEGGARPSGLALIKQEKGTYAGESISYASEEYDKVHKDGFDYLTNIEKDRNPRPGFSVDWKVEDTWKVWDETKDVHVKLTVLNETDEVSLADGAPPQNKPGNPKKYRYLLCKRGDIANQDTLETQFVSVLEAYRDQSVIEKIERAAVTDSMGKPAGFEAAAVKVTLKNQRVDYIITSVSKDTYTIDGKIKFRGFLGVCSFQNGGMIYSYTNDAELFQVDGRELVHKKLAYTGKVMDFTKELAFENQIVVSLDEEPADLSELTGRYIQIENDNVRNACYEIKRISKNTDGSYTITIGDVTTIRSYVDHDDFSKGYLYDLAEGAGFIIPLSCETIAH